MKTRFWLAILVATAVVASGTALRAQDADMDHAALASSYDAEASAAKAKAAEHQKMLSRYQSIPMFPKGSPTTKEQMVKHCQSLVDSYQTAATQASDLAKAHRSMAQQTE